MLEPLVHEQPAPIWETLTLGWVQAAHRRLLVNRQYGAHRWYLFGRGLHLDDAKRWQLGARYLQVTLPVYVRSVVKQRIDGKQCRIAGSSDMLFNTASLTGAKRVLICDNPFDAIVAARELGPAWAVVAPLSGCKSWCHRYNNLIRAKKRIIIGYPNDRAGNRATEFLLHLFPLALRVALPPGRNLGAAWLNNPRLFWEFDL